MPRPDATTARLTLVRLTVGLIAAVTLHAMAIPLLAYLMTDRRPRVRLAGADAPDAVDAGRAFELTWTAANDGNAAGPIHVTATLERPAGEPAHEPVRLGSPHEAVLDASATAAVTDLVAVPAGLDGPWLLRVDAGPAGLVIHPLWVDHPGAGRAVVDAIDAPDAVSAGGALDVAVTLANPDPRYAGGPRADRLYLAATPEPGDGDIEAASRTANGWLAPGAETRFAAHVRLPRGLEGDLYLIAETVGPDGVPHRLARPLRIDPLATADLQVPRVEAPEQMVLGQTHGLHVTVANYGGEATNRSSWADRVVLSTDGTVDADDLVLAEDLGIGPLAPGESYTHKSLRVTLPDDAPRGDVFLIAVTDADGVVDEPGFEDNNTKVVPLRVLTREESQVTLGTDNNEDVTTVAWIPYDELERLQAPKAQTEQPAVQQNQDPVFPAPLTVTAAPPAPSPPVAAAGSGSPSGADTPADAPRPARVLPADGIDPATVDTLDAERVGRAAVLPPSPPAAPLRVPAPSPAAEAPGATRLDDDTRPRVEVDAPDVALADDPEVLALLPRLGPPAAPPRADQAAEREPDPDRPDPQPTPPADASPSADADPGPSDATDTARADVEGDDPAEAVSRPSPPAPPSRERDDDDPTASPREDREAPPTRIDPDTDTVRPGKVLTADGIEIKTVAPDFSHLAFAASVRNPKVRITFNAKGEPTSVEFLRRAGTLVDGEIQGSINRWRATGKRLEQLGRPFQIEVTLLLTSRGSDER